MIQAALRTHLFLERLHAAAAANSSWLCVGLDPEPAADVEQFLLGTIEATRDLVCCYKPNLAFFEALGVPGQLALRSILRAIPDDIPVLVDAKRGDAPHSMAAY